MSLLTPFNLLNCELSKIWSVKGFLLLQVQAQPIVLKGETNVSPFILREWEGSWRGSVFAGFKLRSLVFALSYS